jgi:protein-disulfide isomerase
MGEYTQCFMQRKTEFWIIGIFVAIIVVATIAAALFGSSAPSKPQFNATNVPPLTASDWTRGDATAKVSLIEYGDFQCPACGEYEPIVEQLTKDYGTRVLFAFRNFPLFQIHQDAMIGAQAAEAAGLQGKYWEMHDLLYKKQSEWSAEPASTVVSKFFNGYAQSLGLNVAKFDTDISSSVVTAKVQKDLASGNAAKIDHTPTFFINLTQIPNPANYAGFKAVLDAALASPAQASSTAQ